MKKLFLILISLLTILPAGFAQTKSAKKTTATAKTDAPPAAGKTVKTKKDGTPDMRTKENKQAAKAAKPAGPLKKDGTPDMRYKANKAAKK